MIKKLVLLIIVSLITHKGFSQSATTLLKQAEDQFQIGDESYISTFSKVNTAELTEEEIWRFDRLRAQGHILNGNFDLGVEIITQLIRDVPENKENASFISLLNDDIGRVYISSDRNASLALTYFQESEDLRKSFQIFDENSETYYNLGIAYFRLREPYKAIDYFNKALFHVEKPSKRQGDILYMKGSTLAILSRGGESHLADSALLIMNEAKNTYKSFDSERYTNLLLEEANANIRRGNNESGIKTLMTLLNEPSTKNQQSIRIYSILSSTYAMLSIYDTAYYMRTLENDSLRSYLNDDRFKTTVEITQNLRTEQHVDKLEADIKNLGIALGVLAIVLLISYLIFLQTIQRKKLENLQALIRGEEQERQRLAADLHDGIGVLLTSIKMRLSSFEEKVEDQKAYHQSLDQIDEACVEVRRVSHNLSPASLNKLGLEEAVLDLLDQVQRNSIKTEADVSFNEESIAKENEILIYRIIQELINNSLKYAEPSQLNLSLKAEGDQLNLSYSDQGNGFDKQKVKAGLGLKSIASRVDIMKGKFSYQSILGQGSQFDISIPLNG